MMTVSCAKAAAAVDARVASASGARYLARSFMVVLLHEWTENRSRYQWEIAAVVKFDGIGDPACADGTNRRKLATLEQYRQCVPDQGRRRPGCLRGRG